MSVQAKRHPLPLAPAPSLLDALVPCARRSGCPLGVDVPALARALGAGDAERAWRVARAANPFASTCGSGCHAPCESACTRRTFGAPVAIAHLEQAAASASIPALAAPAGPCTSAHDVRSVAGLVGRTPEEAVRARRSGHRVAIIGAGATGLACAHDLVLLGHQCVVFDAGTEPGGVLTGALPGFRFGVAAARAECAAILQMGVEYQGSYHIAGSGDLRALLAGEFDAVFLALGASAPRESLFPDQPEHERVVDAMSVLAHPGPLEGRVIVVGDGEIALDAARLLRRHLPHGPSGDASVQLVLEAAVDESAVPSGMLAAVLDDQIVVHAGWSAQRWFARDRHQLAALEIGRRAARLSKILPCDAIVCAGPRTAPSAPFHPDVEADALGFIQVDPDTLQTSMARVWAGGACAYGHRSIAHAVADGKRAAWHMHAALTRTPLHVAISALWVEADDWDATRAARSLARPRIDTRHGPMPAADPFAERAARPEDRREADRCLDCATAPVVSDDCTRCGRCVSACPTGALSIPPGGAAPARVDLSRCTRCAACVAACPDDAIVMLRAIWEERLTAAPVPAAQPAPTRARFTTPVA